MHLKGRGTQGGRWLLNFLRDLGTRQMLQSQVIPERLHNSVKGHTLHANEERFPLLNRDLLQDEQQ